MKKLSLILLSTISFLSIPALVQAEYCEFERKIDMELDLSITETLAVIAGAGSLTITGNPGADKAIITGTACASSQELLDESNIKTRSGDQAKITTELPDTDGSWSIWGDRYAYIDLDLVVPDDIQLDVVDGSGSMKIKQVGALSVTDSSGSITIEDTHGPLRLKDSSGSIKMSGIAGDVTVIADSSGSMSGNNIKGSVLVKKDSSGSIRFEDVTGDFIVERDSSGGIVAERIGGDFRVLKDGSGSIRSSQVKGEVSIPPD